MIDVNNLPEGAVLTVRDLIRMRSTVQQRESVVVEYAYSLPDADGNLGDPTIVGYEISYFVGGELTETKDADSEEAALQLASEHVAE